MIDHISREGTSFAEQVGASADRLGTRPLPEGDIRAIAHMPRGERIDDARQTAFEKIYEPIFNKLYDDKDPEGKKLRELRLKFLEIVGEGEKITNEQHNAKYPAAKVLDDILWASPFTAVKDYMKNYLQLRLGITKRKNTGDDIKKLFDTAPGEKKLREVEDIIDKAIDARLERSFSLF